MRILALPKRNSACDYHRIILPLKYINLDVKDEIKIIYDEQDLTRDDLENTDIIFFNRLPPKSIEVLLSYRRAAGYKLVMDLDDFWRLYPHHYLYKSWEKDKVAKQIVDAMKQMDMIITTNSDLAGMIKQHNKKVEVVANAIPFEKGQFYHRPIPSDKVRILFSGGKSHYYDIKSIEPLFDKCKSDADVSKNTKFVLAGVNPNEQDEVWTRTKNIISRVGEFETKEMLPISNYMSLYDEADILLAPLENNSFNKFKSNLKILEAGSKKIPAVCTGIPPYSYDAFCKGVFLCDKTGDWYKNVKNLVMDEGLRKEAGDELYNYVLENYNLEGWNQKRYDILNKISNG